MALTKFIEAETERISGLVKDLPDPDMSEGQINTLLWRELGLQETAGRKDVLEHGK